MLAPVEILRRQYEYVQSSRAVLLDFCATIAAADLLKEHSSFGRGSMRNLLVHLVSTYEFWIGKWGLQLEVVFTDYEAVTSLAQLRTAFRRVDQWVQTYLDGMEAGRIETVTFEFDGRPQETAALKLFTHVITHEFHHKGQILSFSRHLGYTPVDTDVLR